MLTPERKPDTNKPVDVIFPDWAKLKADGKCPTCKATITGFRDQKSLTEYYIGGMCQRCQDNIFGVE